MNHAMLAIGIVAVFGVALAVAGLSILVWAIAVDFNTLTAFGGSLLPIVAVFAVAAGATVVITAARERHRLCR